VAAAVAAAPRAAVRFSLAAWLGGSHPLPLLPLSLSHAPTRSLGKARRDGPEKERTKEKVRWWWSSRGDVKSQEKSDLSLSLRTLLFCRSPSSPQE